MTVQRSNGNAHESPFQSFASHFDSDTNTEEAVAPALRRMVGQGYRILIERMEHRVACELAEYSQACADSIMSEFQTAMAEVQATMAERLKGSLASLVHAEMRSVFAQALGDAAGTPNDTPAPRSARRASPNFGDNLPPVAGGAGDLWNQELVATLATSTAMAHPDASLRTEKSGVATRVAQAPSHGDAAAQPRIATGSPACPDSPDQAIADAPGTAVKLTIKTDGSMRQLIHFVTTLCEKPQFRLLKLVGGENRQGVDLWLALRQPVPLREFLCRMGGEVTTGPTAIGSDSEEQRLTVTLPAQA